MQHPKFTVVTSSVLALAAVGFVVQTMKVLLPKEHYNPLQFEATEFTRRASTQTVRWRQLGPEAFAEARRNGRPILLVIGVPWSGAARKADIEIFSDKDVSTYLNSHFVCVRVDAEQDPTWISSLLPLSRPRLGMLAGLQVWMLEPGGAMVEPVGGFGLTREIDDQVFLSSVQRVQADYEQLRTEDPTAIVPGAIQREDLNRLTSVSTGQPNFALQSRTLKRWAESEFGGFPVGNRVEPTPAAFRYLLRSGDHAELRRRLDPMLRSPLVDWLDGGFFGSVTRAGELDISFNKVATVNAEMMSVLTQSWALLGDPLHKLAAIDTFDSLAGQFQVDGLIASCRIDDPGPFGRSRRSSFSPQMLRDALGSADREWARSVLGLRVEENQPMAIWVKDPQAALTDEARFFAVRERLRRAASTDMRFGSSALLDVNGFTIARMLESARILSDGARLSVARGLFARLDWFRAGDDVKRSTNDGIRAPAYLGDYLAYADASLQCFLTNGDATVFQTGLRVLQRAHFLFGSEVPGVWNSRLKAPSQPGPKDVVGPEVLDAFRESLSAKAMTLENAYGRLIRDPNAAVKRGSVDLAVNMCQEAVSIAMQFGGLSDEMAFYGSGYFASALAVLDDQYAVTVGPGAVETAAKLARLVPTRLCAPALGSVRRDLQTAKPGIYVIKGSKVFGPLSVQQASRLLDVGFSSAPWLPRP